MNMGLANTDLGCSNKATSQCFTACDAILADLDQYDGAARCLPQNSGQQTGRQRVGIGCRQAQVTQA